jgi:peroxiredoxin
MKCKWLMAAAGWAFVVAIALAAMPEVTPAPNFSLDAASGKKISLTDLKGKYVVLEWWNNGCPVVGKHYESGNIPKLQKEFMDQGVVWLTICSSAPGKQGYVTAENANEVMKRMGGRPTDILLDPTGATGRAYKATATPQLVLISPKGEMLYNGAIDDNPRASGEAILKSENYLRRAWAEVKAGQPVSVPVTQAYGCSVKY